MSLTNPKVRRAALAFIFVTAVLDIVAMGIIIPVLPQLIEEFVGSNARAGVINGVFVALWAGMQFICSPIIGSLSDRYGRRPVILISCAGLALDYVLMALAPNLWWLAAGRIIAGITSSSFTTIYAYMADITEPAKRARAYGLIGAAFSGGFVLGPVLGGFLGDFDPRLPFWVAGGLSGVAFFYGLLILPESLPVEKRMAFSWRRANPVGSLILLKRHAELSGLAVVNFLLYFAHHVFSAVFVLYAAWRYGWGPKEVGLLLALVGVLDMLVQGVAVGPLVKRFGDRGVMVFGLLGGTVGIALMGWAPTGLIFILAMLPNALWGLAMPTLQSLMTRRVGEDEQGQLQGANMSVASIAGVMSPLFFGWIYSISVGEGALATRLWLANALDAAPARILALATRVMTQPGLAFYLAAVTLFLAALVGWVVGRRADRDDAADARLDPVQNP
jgi:DHA1 family tetracycline resistance protein-like MFS transporter